MIKNVPSPCCGKYDVLVKATTGKDNKIWYKAECPYCGLKTNDEFDSKSEAIYEYEEMCIQTWKRNHSGLCDWMKTDCKNDEEKERRIQIRDNVMDLLMTH